MMQTFGACADATEVREHRAFMKIVRLLPLAGLLVLAGCGDPKEHLKEALTAAVNKPFSKASDVSWRNTSCVEFESGYSCSITMTYKIFMGAAYTKETTVDIIKTSEGWRLLDENIFYGGELSY